MLNPFSHLDSKTICSAAEQFATPFYLYEERAIVDKCHLLLDMPHPYGLTVRYAIKANPTRALLALIGKEGLSFDASSTNEALRAHRAGIAYSDIMLTSQEVPQGEALTLLQQMMQSGLKYTVSSLQQLKNIAKLPNISGTRLAIRVHPGIGSGESASRNTGDSYACFGVHRDDLATAISYAWAMNLIFDKIHCHIGSGADMTIWQDNIDRQLQLVAEHFPHAHSVSFGGGLAEARMPAETAADIMVLGAYAKERLLHFYRQTGRKLHMEIEPGTFIIANAGYVVTRVIDIKKTGRDGLNFIVCDGGMDLNTRPLLYASQHPFYVVSQSGELLFSEFYNEASTAYSAVVVGSCCESGDSQTLNLYGQNMPRSIAEPCIGDYLVIGGCGAYCSSMSLHGYNSHPQAAELLLTSRGELCEIRARQTLEQLLVNEK